MTESLSMDQAYIRRLTDIVLANLANENFGAEDLAKGAGMSRVSLYRRLQYYKHEDISQFIRKVRLKRAYEMLLNNEGTASEISFKVGFGSPAYFSKCFHDHYGYPPGEVKKSGTMLAEPENASPDAGKEEKIEVQDKQVKTSKKKLQIFIIIIGIVLVVAAMLVYPKIFKRDNPENLISSDGRIPVAVMPFQNLTNDTINNYLQDGIQKMLTTSLSNFKELKVKPTRSVENMIRSKGITDYASISLPVASSISKKLYANVFVLGNLIRSGTEIRLNAHLINSKSEEIIKSFQINGTTEHENIMSIIDTLSSQIGNFLIISELRKENWYLNTLTSVSCTNSLLAFKYFSYGINAERESGDYSAAIKWYIKAIDVDSNFTLAMLTTIYNYVNLRSYDQAKKWCLRYCEKKDFMSVGEKLEADYWYAYLFETPDEAMKYLRQKLDMGIDAQLFTTHAKIGGIYIILYQYDKAIPEFEKQLDIRNKQHVKPEAFIYNHLMRAYHKTGQYKNEKKLLKIAEQDYPDNPLIISRHAILSLREGDTKEEYKSIEKLKSIGKDKSWTEAGIKNHVAWIYSEAGILDKAEDNYRKALSLEPKNPVRMNSLAYFLIDNGLNVIEGLGLVDKALEIHPEDYSYLDTKGWGLYKQGKYNEALEILQKSWEIRRKEAIYNHDAFLHLEATKKAVAQKP